MKNPHLSSQITAAVTVIAVFLTANAHAALPAVPGATTTVYATLEGPQQVDLAADGTMYVGHDIVPGTRFQYIWQIGPGGSPVAAFGDQSIEDADGLVIDRTGSFTGTPGTILVGGMGSGVSQIAPSGAVTTLFPGSSFGNIDNLVFDHAGRLLITDDALNAVLATPAAGTAPQVLCQKPYTYCVAEDAAGRLLVSGSDTDISLFAADGTLLNASFLTVGPTLAPLASSKGGFWGTNIYTVEANGNLLRVDLSGVATPVGSGFSDAVRIYFGGDGSLYVSDENNSRILKISPEPPRATIRLSCVDICWNSYSNQICNVQYRSELTTNTWVDLFTNIMATGTETCVTDTIARGQPQRYYRVVALP